MRQRTAGRHEDAETGMTVEEIQARKYYNVGCFT
jgi:hypothetical protein